MPRDEYGNDRPATIQESLAGVQYGDSEAHAARVVQDYKYGTGIFSPNAQHNPANPHFNQNLRFQHIPYEKGPPKYKRFPEEFRAFREKIGAELDCLSKGVLPEREREKRLTTFFAMGDSPPPPARKAGFFRRVRSLFAMPGILLDFALRSFWALMSLALHSLLFLAKWLLIAGAVVMALWTAVAYFARPYLPDLEKMLGDTKAEKTQTAAEKDAPTRVKQAGAERRPGWRE